MKKLLLLFALFAGSLDVGAQVTRSQVNTMIIDKLTSTVKPSDIRAVAQKLNDFSNQADSIARTRESFIAPGSSSSYLNGLKQWVPFPTFQAPASSQIITALGFTPYDAANPAGYLTGITSAMVNNALGYTPYNAAINASGFLTSISSAQVVSALGFTPYSASNPAGYISGITGTQVNTALGFAPYSASNPAGYISGITAAQVNTALGFTPYNGAVNPNGYLNASGFKTINGNSIVGAGNIAISTGSGGITTESDPTVPASVKSITDANILAWNAKISTETDPTVPASVKAITDASITSWNAKLSSESDPTVPANVKSISTANLAKWNTSATDSLVVHKSGSETITGAKTFTGTVTLPSATAIGSVSSIELGYVDNATSNIQTQLNAKAPLASPTFTGTVTLPATTNLKTINGTSIVGTGDITVSAGGSPTTPFYYTTVAAMEATRPADGTMVITGGYWTMGDGGGGKYYFDAASTASDNNGTVQAPTVGNGAGRWLAIIEDNTGVSPRLFGAKGNNNSVTFDDPAFVSLFAWVKSVFQANLNGTRNDRFPKGISIVLGYGSYTTITPMPIFTGLHIAGAGGNDANENANNTLWTCRGTTTFVYSDLASTYNGADIDDFTLQGIAFYGAKNMTVGLFPPFAGTQIRNSKILNCGFRYLKKVDIYGIVLHLQKNYFNFMAEGCLRMGASDCVVSDNVIGGGGFPDDETVPNVRRAAVNSYVRVIELQAFGNSRFDNNYISGDFTSPSAIPLYIENSHTSWFTNNWYDYSDGPNIQIRYSNNLTFNGGIVQGSNRKNPDVATTWGEHECAVFIGNSNNISFNGTIFREIPMAGTNTLAIAPTAGQVTVRMWGNTTANNHFTDIQTGRQGATNNGTYDANSGTKYVFTYALENGAETVANNNTFEGRDFGRILRVFTDNAAATTAGLPLGESYRTADGTIKVRY